MHALPSQEECILILDCGTCMDVEGIEKLNSWDFLSIIMVHGH